MKKSLTAVLIIANIISIYAEDQQLKNYLYEGGPEARNNYELKLLKDPATGLIPPQIRAKEIKFSKNIPTKENSKTNRQMGINLTQRGPRNLGGRTRALAIDVYNENIILAGAVSGGMWRSIDGGASWVMTSKPEHLPSVTCISQDTRQGKSNYWYYGTGEFIGNSAASPLGNGIYPGDGIFRSTDNGVRWEQIPSTVSNTPQEEDLFDYVLDIVAYPDNSDDEVVFAALRGGIYKWTSSSDTWELVLGKAPTVNYSLYTDIAVSPGGTLYAALGYVGPYNGATSNKWGLYKSHDGINWDRIDSSSDFAGSKRIEIAIAPSDDRIVYFFSSNFDNENHTLYRYYDDPEGNPQWKNLSYNIPDDYSSQSSYDIVIKVKPDNPNVVFLGGTNLYRSVDGFSTGDFTYIGGYNQSFDFTNYMNWDKYKTLDWWKMTYPNHWPDQHELCFLPSDPNVMFSACDGGLFKTNNNLEDSVVWETLNNGYITNQFYSVAINEYKAGDNTIIGGMQDKGTFGTNEAEPGDWHWIAGNDGSYCAIPAEGNELFASSQYGYIVRAEMNENFHPESLLRMHVQNLSIYSFFIAPFTLDPHDENNMYLSSYMGVLRNKNIRGSHPGYEWERIQVTNENFVNVSALHADRTVPGRIYYATDDVYYGYTNHIYRVDNALDDNAKRTTLQTSGFDHSAYINCVVTDPENEREIIAVLSNYNTKSVFYSSNAGETWICISGNLEENTDGSGSGPSCRWAEFLHTDEGRIILLGTSTGLYSTDRLEGQHTVWVKEGANSIGNAVVTMVKVRQSDGFVAVATHGKGVFAGYYGGQDSANEKENTPAYIEQNYPNPANTGTNIKVFSPGNGLTTINLYDPLGKLIQNICNEELSEGPHDIIVNTSTLPSGYYFYKMTCGNYQETKMMQVVH